MKRTGIKRKIRRRSQPLRVSDPDLVRNYIASKDRCDVCHAPVAKCRLPERFTPGLDPHHLARSANRSDEICNLVAGCHLCHACAHIGPEGKVIWRGQSFPHLPLGALFRIKRTEFPDEWDHDRLLLLRRGPIAVERGGCELDAECELPGVFLLERERWAI